MQEQFVFIFYFVGAMGCLACSTIFHLFYCHSHQHNAFYSSYVLHSPWV